MKPKEMSRDFGDSLSKNVQGYLGVSVLSKMIHGVTNYKVSLQLFRNIMKGLTEIQVSGLRMPLIK
jgi:hypothetical protein